MKKNPLLKSLLASFGMDSVKERRNNNEEQTFHFDSKEWEMETTFQESGYKM